MHRIFRWLFTKSENPEIVPPEQSAASSRSVSHRSVSHQSVSHQSASHQSASHRSVSNKSASVPSIFLPHLKKLEPNARFEFLPPDLIKSSNRGKIYYAKMGIIPRRREVHRAEAKLVKILDESAPKLALTVLASGFFTCNDGGSGSKTYRTYFLYEGRQLMSLSLASARILGERLAKEVHSRKYPHGFGIYSSRNHRSDKSDHDCYPSWDKCFDALIGGALSRLDCEVYPALCDKGQKVKKQYVLETKFERDYLQHSKFCSVVPVLLSPQRLVIKPVLIHGNLWEDIWVRLLKLRKIFRLPNAWFRVVP